MVNLFDPRALANRRSSRLNTKPVRLLTPPLRAVLLLALMLSGLGLAWAFLARIPLLSNGIGIVLPANSLGRIFSRSSGRIVYYFNGRTVQPPAWAPAMWRFSRHPEDASLDELLQLADVMVHPPRQTQLLQEVMAHPHQIPYGTLLAQVDSPQEIERLALSYANVRSQIITTNQAIAQIQAKNGLLQAEIHQRQKLLDGMRQVVAGGAISREMLLSAQANLDAVRGNYLANLQAIGNSRQQLADQVAALRAALGSLSDRTLVFAPGNIYIQLVPLSQYTQVTPGSDLLVFSNQPLQLPSQVPVYLRAIDAARVFPGMAVIATPRGVDRSQYGGIRGTVVEVDRLPASRSQIVEQIGVGGISDQIQTSLEGPTQATLQLAKTPGSQSYRWSGPVAPPLPVKVGDRLDVLITTGTIHPIEMVLPFLRRALGIAAPIPYRGG